jgi:hypothetical protein
VVLLGVAVNLTAAFLALFNSTTRVALLHAALDPTRQPIHLPPSCREWRFGFSIPRQGAGLAHRELTLIGLELHAVRKNLGGIVAVDRVSRRVPLILRARLAFSRDSVPPG